MTSTPQLVQSRRTKNLRRHAGASGGFAGQLSGELFGNEADVGGLILYWGAGDDGNGNSTSQQPIGGVGAFVDKASAQTIAGLKTFSTSPAVPATAPTDASGALATTRHVLNVKNPLYYYGYVGTGICAPSLAISAIYGTAYPCQLATITSINGQSTVNAFTGTTTGPSGSGGSQVPGSPTITGLNTTTNVQVGQVLTNCANFPVGSQVVSISGSSITLNNNATASGSCSFNLSWALSQWQGLKQNAVALTDMICNPISTVGYFAGQSTAGWTLANWQALVPQIKSWWDEIDGVAIQALVNSYTSQAAISLPHGIAVASWPILSGRAALFVEGKGQWATSLIQAVGGQDGWHHGTSDSGHPNVYNAHFEMRNVALQCSGVGGTALTISGAGSAGVMLDVVQAFGVGNTGQNYWHDGCKFQSCSYVLLSQVGLLGINNGYLPNTGTALSFTGIGTAQYSITDTTVDNYQYAITAQSGGGTDMEGFVLQNFQANQVMYGITTSYNPGSNASFRSPQWYIHNCQWNIFVQWLNFDHIQEVNVVNNLTYCGTDFTKSGTFTAQPWVRLNAVSSMNFMNNSLEFYAGNNVAGLIFMAGGCDTISFLNNTFHDYGSTMTYGYWNTDTSSTNILEKNSRFGSWQVSASKVAGALNGASNRFETYFTQYGFELLSDGKASYTGSIVGTTNTSGQLAVTFPANMFISAPTVMACNGDSGSLAQPGAVLASSVTTSGFTFQFFNVSTAASARVNFTLSGV